MTSPAPMCTPYALISRDSATATETLQGAAVEAPGAVGPCGAGAGGPQRPPEPGRALRILQKDQTACGLLRAVLVRLIPWRHRNTVDQNRAKPLPRKAVRSIYGELELESQNKNPGLSGSAGCTRPYEWLPDERPSMTIEAAQNASAYRCGGCKGAFSK